ncbi:hypothetical protein BKA65DRAFT_77725 [Rhexocercosporidium sp. MPI-PUGE-AT-0058]|nr:hypothetical protein BKA65DRAFT_77725 [Rhexocercosporidium sp. MPI-PUGE-AT-0058]
MWRVGKSPGTRDGEKKRKRSTASITLRKAYLSSTESLEAHHDFDMDRKIYERISEKHNYLDYEGDKPTREASRHKRQTTYVEHVSSGDEAQLKYNRERRRRMEQEISLWVKEVPTAAMARPESDRDFAGRYMAAVRRKAAMERENQYPMSPVLSTPVQYRHEPDPRPYTDDVYLRPPTFIAADPRDLANTPPMRRAETFLASQMTGRYENFSPPEDPPYRFSNPQPQDDEVHYFVDYVGADVIYGSDQIVDGAIYPCPRPRNVPTEILHNDESSPQRASPSAIRKENKTSEGNGTAYPYHDHPFAPRKHRDVQYGHEKVPKQSPSSTSRANLMTSEGTSRYLEHQSLSRTSHLSPTSSDDEDAPRGVNPKVKSYDTEKRASPQPHETKDRPVSLSPSLQLSKDEPKKASSSSKKSPPRRRRRSKVRNLPFQDPQIRRSTYESTRDRETSNLPPLPRAVPSPPLQRSQTVEASGRAEKTTRKLRKVTRYADRASHSDSSSGLSGW